MRFTKFVGVLAGLSLFAASCGNDDTATDTIPVVEDAPDADEAGAGAAETGDVPTRIISLSPTHTEMLFAIGAGDQVVAVDDFSNYPPEAAEKMTDLSGWAPNVEAIASYEPDLVVTDGTNPDLLDQLDSLGIARWEGPAAASFSDIYDQIEQLGAATGNIGDAAELVSSMQAEIDEITADLPELGEPLTYYHELDNTYFSITSDTFIGYVYGQLGLRSIADLAEGSGGQYPQLNAEFILSEDPDLIFLACTTYCGESAETVAARDGWGQLSALQNGLVIELDDDTSSRWGPRIVDFYREVADAVAMAVEAQPVG
jgi:iron complex transport system substrate-binding protein